MKIKFATILPDFKVKLPVKVIPRSATAWQCRSMMCNILLRTERSGAVGHGKGAHTHAN
jgi:hypothetical protein